MALWVTEAGHVAGFYGYESREDELTLRGEIGKDDESLTLYETDASGKTTGGFDLRFDAPDDSLFRGKDLAAYDCTYLTGTWAGASDRRHQKIMLVRAGWLNEAYKSEREVDEAAAYRLQMAIANGDARAFEELLSYPVNTQGFDSESDIWNSVDDVKRDFNSVLVAKRARAPLAVPHALHAGPLGASFWGGSVCLSQGRVTQICASGCEGGCP
jgi:hypothetical protein